MPQSTLSETEAKKLAWELSAKTSVDAEERLRAPIEALAGASDLRDWLDARVAEDRLRGQLLWRHALANFSTLTLDDDTTLLLAAFPVLLDTLVWDTARLEPELAAWCATQFELDRGDVAVNPAPVALHSAMAGHPAQSRIRAHELAATGVGNWNCEPSEEAVYLWPVTFSLTPRQGLRAQQHLRKVGQASLAFHSLRHRCAALAEVVGAQLTLYPLSSWANAPTLARIAGFRRWAERNLHEGSHWAAALQGHVLSLRGAEGAGGRFTFAWETRDDLRTMLASTAKARACRIDFTP